jgi:hypothetical protein
MASEKEISEAISLFHCEKDKDIETFLHQKATLFDEKSKCRTYLIFDEKASKFRILAYFSLAIQLLKIPEGMSNTQIKKLDGLYSKRNGTSIAEVPAYLIGQFAKSDCSSGEITGHRMMEYALSFVKKAQSIVGGRIVYIECKPHPKIIAFYAKEGFRAFRKSPDDGLLQMYCII